MKNTIEILKNTLIFIFGMIFLFAFLTFVVLINLKQASEVNPIIYYVFGVAVGAFVSFLITSCCIHWKDNFK